MNIKKMFKGAEIWSAVYANDLDPWNPELWARESIEILYESWIYGGLVHRGFDSEVAAFGDLVHTRKPAEFESEPWGTGDDVIYQDATATDVQVKLDQVIDVSFLIGDLEQSYSFADLVKTYIRPAAAALARKVDLKIAGQAVQFLGNSTGGMGNGSSGNVRDRLVDTEKAMNDLKTNEEGRNLVISSGMKADILKTDLFVKVNESGDNTALRRAGLGDMFGMNMFMSLNTPSVVNTDTETADTIDGTFAAGVTTLKSTGTVPQGSYITVVGDMTPLKKIGGSTVNIDLNRATRESIIDNAAITVYSQGAIDLVAGYAAGWVKKIAVDGGAVPHVGQIISFDVAGVDEYMITRVTDNGSDKYDIELDRALVVAMSDGETVSYGPSGTLNLCFQQNGIALVNRPMALPRTNDATIAVAQDGHIAIRVAMSWDQDTKSRKVSLDALFGIKTLDPQFGNVLLS